MRQPWRTFASRRAFGSVAGALALLCAACPDPAFARRADRAPAAAVSEQEAADARTVRAAFESFDERGFAAFAEHAPALRAVLDRAPASYPRVEARGEVTIARSDGDSKQDLVLMLATAAAAQKGKLKTARAEVAYNVYPLAAFALASLANEMKRHEEAVAYADRGLALQPEHAMLTVERGSALLAMGRPGEAVAAYEAALASNDLVLQLDRGRLLRNKGVALIDLGRLDEAEAALKQSLKLEPGNRLVMNELLYIAQLRAGRAPMQGELLTPDQQEKRLMNPPRAQAPPSTPT